MFDWLDTLAPKTVKGRWDLIGQCEKKNLSHKASRQYLVGKKPVFPHNISHLLVTPLYLDSLNMMVSYLESKN